MSGYQNHNNENQPIFQEQPASKKNGNFTESSSTINQISDLQKNNTDYFKARKTFESAYFEAKTFKADNLRSGKNINKKLTYQKSTSTVNQLKSNVFGILAGTAIVFPIMGMVTVTNYFGRKAINEQTESVKLLKNTFFSKIELSQQKKLLTALLIGTEAITSIAGIMAALQVKKLVSGKISELDSEIEPEETRADVESSNLGGFDLEKSFLQDIVEEARNSLKCDRVLVYSLNSDRYGTVVAESVVPGYTKALNKVISDPCFEVRYLEKYRDGRVRALNNIYDAKIPSCYLEQLKVLDVRANLVTPIINEGKLFGLLVAHQCSEARHWQDYEIRWLTQIATQVGFALDNVQTLSLAKQQEALIEREREWTNYFTDAVQYIRQSLNQKDILNISVEEVRRVMMCDRVVVYNLNSDRYGTVVAESVVPGYTKALNKVISDPCFETRYLEKYRNGRVRALNNIDEADLPPCYLKQLKVLEVKANLVTPIINEGKLFGLLVAHQCSEARHWQDYEIRWLTQIATQVGFALDNARVLGELNSQNIATQVFKNFIASIRQCPGREELLKTAVEQVCMGMFLDRVIVYQFDREWNGTIVAESVVPGYPKSLNSYIQDPCFARQYEKKYFQGYVKAISNVREANLTECHLEKLKSLAVKAIIIAPIMQNEELFGLFIGHQCSQTRDWELPEMETFSQLTLQLGLALERVALKEELSFPQDSRENDAIEPISGQNNTFPQRISELQKISELLVENQNTLHKIKFKIDNKSSDKTSLVDRKEGKNHDSITIDNEGENYL